MSAIVEGETVIQFNTPSNPAPFHRNPEEA